MGRAGWASAHPPAGDMAWMDQAACASADPALFAEVPVNPGRDTLARVEAAAAWCAHCPVLGGCLVFGRTTGASGVYGGMILTEGRFSTVTSLAARVARTHPQADHDRQGPSVEESA